MGGSEKRQTGGWLYRRGELSIKGRSSNLLHTMTFHWLLQVYCIAQKMHISEYVCKNFLEELAFLCRETFEKLLQTVTFLHILLFHFQILFKVITVHFNKSLWYDSDSGMLLWAKLKVRVFDPVARGNTADTTSCCQMMSYSHVQNNPIRNEHLTLNFENKTLH